MFPSQDDRPPAYRIVEQTRTPASSIVLAYLPMVPFAAGAVWVWATTGDEVAATVRLTLLWGGAILAFLAGVRRGLTFRSPNGETMPQLITMFYLFVLAIAALLASPSQLSIGLLVLGFASLAVMDWRAARREEVPPYFARLRPVQMMIPIICLLAMAPKAAVAPAALHTLIGTSPNG